MTSSFSILSKSTIPVLTPSAPLSPRPLRDNAKPNERHKKAHVGMGLHRLADLWRDDLPLLLLPLVQPEDHSTHDSGQCGQATRNPTRDPRRVSRRRLGTWRLRRRRRGRRGGARRRRSSQGCRRSPHGGAAVRSYQTRTRGRNRGGRGGAVVEFTRVQGSRHDVLDAEVLGGQAVPVADDLGTDVHRCQDTVGVGILAGRGRQWGTF